MTKQTAALTTAKTQITQMLTMQDAMNSRVSETWRDNGTALFWLNVLKC